MAMGSGAAAGAPSGSGGRQPAAHVSACAMPSFKLQLWYWYTLSRSGQPQVAAPDEPARAEHATCAAGLLLPWVRQPRSPHCAKTKVTLPLERLCSHVSMQSQVGC